MGHDPNPRLSELTSICDRLRKGGKRYYNEEAKALVRELADAGIGPTALARASGVAVGAIRKWVNDAPDQAPRRDAVKVLKVEGGGEKPDHRPAVLTIRASDFEVTIRALGGGRP